MSHAEDAFRVGLLFLLATQLLAGAWYQATPSPLLRTSANELHDSNPLADANATLSPNQPCLSPGPADISTTQIQATNVTGKIPGNTVPDVQNGKAAFKSSLPSDFALNLELTFKIRNPNQFDKCLQSINDPTSTNYGQFLTMTTLQPYLPSPGQKLSVASYLSKSGLNVADGASPLVLKVTGNVATASRVFGVRIGIYSENSNVTFFAADSDPQLPQNFAVLVNGVIGLDNFTLVKHVESPCSGPYCPQGVQVGYSISNLFASGFNGSGQKVAVVDAPGDPNIQLAITTYSTQYSLPQIVVDVRYPDGIPTSYDAGWAAEAAMDVEAVHAVAPGAGIVLLYDSVSLMNAIDYVATNNLAKVVSNSWVYICAFGACSDTQLSSSFVSSIDSRLATDSAQGLTILFASGDQGAKPDGTHLGTEFPASDPNVLAIGATNLVLSGCGTTTCTGYGSESGAVISGGGYSGHFSEPSWQTSAIGTKSGRAVPDVSMLGYSPNFWVYSSLASSCGGGTGGGWFPCAGTSLSTPLWAGFFAIALQMKGSGSFGNAAPRLYQLGSGSSYSTLFHDVTSGSNNGYSAGTRWDPVTGWGSPIANNLAAALAQIVMTVSYSVSGGGTPTAPTLNYVQGAIPKPYSLTTSPTTVSLDIGSTWSVTPNPLTGSSAQERWYSNQTLTGAPANVSLIFTFYHQYVETLSYSVVGGGSGYSAPSFVSTVFGSSASKTLTASGTGYWFDSGSSWSVTNPLTGSTTSERWATPQSAGTISSAQTINFAYQHQFMLTTQSSPPSAGTVSPSSGWQNAGISVPVTATSNSPYSFYYWSQDGTNVGSANPYSVLMSTAHTLTAIYRGTSSITLALSTGSVTIGNPVILYGTISPSPGSPGIPAGTTVVISSSTDGGATWNLLLTTSTNSTAGYSVTWNPQNAMTYQLQASWSGDSNYAGSTSSPATLTVTGAGAPRITMIVSGPTSTARGSTATFNVVAFNPGTQLTTTIYMEVTGPGGYRFFDTMQVVLTANNSSRFQLNWAVPSTASTGSYQISVGLIPPTPYAYGQTQITVT